MFFTITNKLALSSFEDKRAWIKCNTSLPYGHYSHITHVTPPRPAHSSHHSAAKKMRLSHDTPPPSLRSMTPIPTPRSNNTPPSSARSMTPIPTPGRMSHWYTDMMTNVYKTIEDSDIDDLNDILSQN